MTSKLTGTEVAKLKKQLDERLSELTQAIRSELLSSGAEQHQKLAGRVHDTKDQSFAELIRDVNVGMVQLHATELNDIDHANKRIGAGTYGVCIECELPIGFERLAAYPTAKRCRPCQAAHEETL